MTGGMHQQLLDTSHEKFDNQLLWQNDTTNCHYKTEENIERIEVDEDLNMSHFTYACKMRYPLNLVLESWEYLWFYWTFAL